MFKPAFALSNSHLQTIYASLFRKEIPIEYEIREFTLSDGDFLECFWHTSNKQDANTPLVIIFHGLAGNYKSPYIQGIVQQLSDNNFDSVIMHFRGCSGRDNRLPRSYHSGDTGDALEFLESLTEEFKGRKLYAVGYSLGANMLLKLLGELGDKSMLSRAVSVSPPMLLDVCASKMNRGLSRYYQYRLLKDLKLSLEKKYAKHPMEKLLRLQLKEIQKLSTFWEFDDAYTAPIHGFSSADEYYKKSSSRQFLKSIKTQTLIIHSEDDPFMTPAVIPNKEELSESVRLEVTKKGGHVGFVGGSLLQPEYWLERHIVKYLKED